MMSLIPDWDKFNVVVSSGLVLSHPIFCNELKSIIVSRGYGFWFADHDHIWLRDSYPLVGRGFLVRYSNNHTVKDFDSVILEGVSGRVDLFLDSEKRNFDFDFEGGNLTTDGVYSICCESLISGGNDLEIRRSFEKLTGTKLIVISKEETDTIGHADGYIRFVAPGVVVFGESNDGVLWNRISEMLLKEGIGVIPFPCLCGSGDDAWGCYVNFLAVGKLAVYPKFDPFYDKIVEKRLSNFFCDVVGIEVPRDILMEGGALNCLTWTF